LKAYTQAGDINMCANERAKKQTQEQVEQEDKAEDGGELSSLFSGKMTDRTGKRKKSKKRERAVELLPEDYRAVADVLAAGKAIEKEIKTKIGYSEQRIKEYCIKRFCEKFASTGHRPTSGRYAGNKSRFTFIQTKKIYLTPEKADALRSMNVPIDEFTELMGIDIDYSAIKANHLEFKLRAALEKMNVPQEVLDECFRPRVELKESFFETLNSVIEKSLQEGESIVDKLVDVVSVLGPVNQIKNPEIPGMSPEDGLKLVIETEIGGPGEEEAA
jgi:hypothetical protein